MLNSSSTIRLLVGCAAWLLSAATQAAVVLQYHHISEETPAATSISPQLFREHMAYLQEAGYRVLPLEDLVAQRKAGKNLPDKTVAITFDDGYRSIYSEAFPVLKQYGWPFTVFLNTQPMQEKSRQHLRWDELREMAAAGASIVNHTHSHLHMIRRLEGESEKRWRQRIEADINRAQALIEKEVGEAPRIFAYPYGEYDRATQTILADLGYAAFGQQSGPLGGYEDLQSLPRFPFGGVYGAMNDFKTKVASLPMPLAKVEVMNERGQSPLIDTVLPAGQSRPILRLSLSEPGVAGRIQCFASGQGAIPLRVEGQVLVAQAEKALPVGRSRYNCTAMSKQQGRFYWYSQVFIRKQADGEWYAEP